MRVQMGAKHLLELGRGGCPKGQVKRVGYTRKDGVKVKSACVPDKGAPGKTPAAKRWFPRDGKPLGWKKDMTASERHGVLRRKTEQDGCRPVIRALVARANVTTDRETERKMRADAQWLHDQRFCKLKTKA